MYAMVAKKGAESIHWWDIFKPRTPGFQAPEETKPITSYGDYLAVIQRDQKAVRAQAIATRQSFVDALGVPEA